MKQQKVTIVLAAALFMSLSVNFFLAGLMIGDAVTPAAPEQAKEAAVMSERERRQQEWQKREEALNAALNAEDRAVMRDIKAIYDPLFDGLRNELDTARAKVGAAMEADPLDQEVLDDAIANEAAIKSRLLQAMTDVRRATIEQLSPEGSRILREMMPFRRGPGAGGPPPEHGGPHGVKPPRDGHLPPHEHGKLAPAGGQRDVPADAALPPDAVPLAGTSEEDLPLVREDIEPPPHP
ncbi:MAG: periplasmic heavy metal sensor [Bdellovibrionales bacterium]|jgi:hypothetical protein|nr:periplasmic heavy metal sensor [Bdellovibrionales bacterium]